MSFVLAIICGLVAGFVCNVIGRLLSLIWAVVVVVWAVWTIALALYGLAWLLSWTVGHTIPTVHVAWHTYGMLTGCFAGGTYYLSCWFEY